MQFPDKIRKDTAPSRQSVSAEELEKCAEAEKPMAKVAQKSRIFGKKQPVKDVEDKKVIDKADSSLYSDVNDILPKLSEQEQQIVDLLKSGEKLVDDVIAQSGLPAGKVLATLTLLEVKGVVKRLPGKRVCLPSAN